MLQLLHMVDKWTECLEQGGQIDSIYSDFEKAFDKVPHKRLSSKLHAYGLWTKGQYYQMDKKFSKRQEIQSQS